MPDLQHRIDEARQRLHAALLAGEDTKPHREALRLLEADLRAQAAGAEAEHAETAAERAERIEARALALTAEAVASIEATISRFPIPQRQEAIQ